MNPLELKYDYDDPCGPQLLTIGTPWAEELQYYVSLGNAKECTDRLKELISEYSDGAVFCELTREDIKCFLGEESEGLRYLAYQEYEGPKDIDAIKTFFLYAYCFTRDFDDEALLANERFLIWIYGYGSEIGEVKRYIYHLKDVKAVLTTGKSSEAAMPSDKVRISVWRILETK